MKTTTITPLPVAECSPGPVNRKHIPENQIKELAQSMKHEGQLQPILVRPRPRVRLLEPDLTEKLWRIVDASNQVLQDFAPEMESPARLYFATCNHEPPFEIVAGECRWRAAKLLKQATVDAVIRDDLDEKAAIKARLAENLHRAGLSALDEAAQFQAALAHGYTVPTLAKEIRRSRSHIFARLRLLTASEPLRKALEEDRLPASIDEMIATIGGAKAQEKALKDITGYEEYDYETRTNVPVCMSARRAKEYIEREHRISLDKAIFPLDQPIACQPPCAECPKRSGNLDPESPRPNVCTDPGCYADKAETHRKTLLLKAAGEKGQALPLSETGKLFTSWGDFRSDQYARASDIIPGDKKERTYAQVLKNPPPIVALDRQDKPVKLIDLQAAAPLLEAAGIKTEDREPKTQDGRSRASAAARAKQELEYQVARRLPQRLLTQASAALANPKLPEKVETALWRALVIDANFYLSPDQEIYTRRGWKAGDTIVKLADRLDRPALRSLWFEICGAEMGRDATATLRAALGLDCKAIEKEVLAELADERKLPKDGAEIEVPQSDLEEWADLCAPMAASDGKLKQSLEFRGRTWWIHGSCGQGNKTLELNLTLLVPANEYKGQTGTDAQINAGRDPSKTAATSIGVKLACAGQACVCSKPRITLVPANASKPTTK